MDAKVIEEEIIAEPETVVAPANAVEQLKLFSMLSADTGMYETVLPYYPRFVTTNPTLIREAIKAGGEYRAFLDAIIEKHKRGLASVKEKVSRCLEEIPVAWGMEMLGQIRGRVSTQVDVRLETADNFVAAARAIYEHYKARGISTDRVLVKVPATVEGIRACERLEREGIHCNVTLVFSLEQAAFAAEAGATVLSPFVGRISDWWRKHESREYAPDEDPGMVLVRKAFAYCKAFKLRTMVLAASMRNVQQVLACAGCDVISMPPALLAEMTKLPGSSVTRKLHADMPAPCDRFHFTDLTTKWKLPQDAQELLDQGLRRFADDEAAIEELVRRGIEA